MGMGWKSKEIGPAARSRVGGDGDGGEAIPERAGAAVVSGRPGKEWIEGTRAADLLLVRIVNNRVKGIVNKRHRFAQIMHRAR
jgi:hypothetical protein